MSSRSLRFFMTSEELWEKLGMMASTQSVRVYISPIRESWVEEWSPSVHPSNLGDKHLFVYFTELDARLDPASLPDVAIGKAGIVTIWVGGREGNRLYLNDQGTKSDWFEDGLVYNNPEVLKLHDRLKKAMIKGMRRGVMLANVRGEPVRLLRDMFISPGAADFYAAGGELMQRGVANSRFTPPADKAP